MAATVIESKSLMNLTLLSPAKLNLFLHILGRRTDGYHQLQTVFQLLDYGDTMNFALRDDKQIVLSKAIAGIENEDNLIIKAAKALQTSTGSHQASGVTIQIDKQLPMGGGLGGGSSNAATTLVALNHLWRTNLNCKELCDIGITLGADVPVFIQGHSAWAEGIGEQLQAIDLPEKWFLVIKPDCHVPTIDIFSREELTRDTLAITVAAFFEQGGKNDCELVVCKYYPEVAKALKWLRNHTTARLTGTGACIFAAFSNESDAKRVYKEALKQGEENRWACFVAKGINQSAVLPFLS